MTNPTQAKPPVLDQRIMPQRQNRAKANGPRTTVAKLAIDATREVDELRIAEFKLYVKSVKYQFATYVLTAIVIAQTAINFWYACF